jgi:hypothetical protein
MFITTVILATVREIFETATKTDLITEPLSDAQFAGIQFKIRMESWDQFIYCLHSVHMFFQLRPFKFHLFHSHDFHFLLVQILYV